MTNARFALAALLSAVTVLWTSALCAQTQSSAAPREPVVSGTDSTYEVAFDDDPLSALGADEHIARIRVRPARTLALLLRPRVSFVSEMLQSVEKL